ncbi:MAG: ATPase [Firmicutes bacterium]|jgi:N-acetylglucosamine kinase|nr:ATPase [Bacillota bacterium]MDH7494434.1 BadF/BadG/BcrA/BcrD ATPase family protein [Bacillota bacterium]
MGLIIGIDAGGTKTDCLVGTVHGEVLARAWAGPANFQVSGPAGVKQEVLAAIGRARNLLPAGDEAFDIAFLGIAGVGRPGDLQEVAGVLDGAGLAGRTVVDNDAVIALAGGTLGQPGVVVIAGTGSIAFGMNSRGERARSGGWGYLLGDEGSAYDIGRQALASVVRASDGRGDPTALFEAVLQHLKVASPEDLVELAYRKGLGRTDIAGLAVVVAETARKGDRVARRILRRAGEELGLAAASVVKALGMQDDAVLCVTSGGVFAAGDVVRKALARELEKTAPVCEVVGARFPPVVGAYLLGIQEAGFRITGKIVENIEDSLVRSS